MFKVAPDTVSGSDRGRNPALLSYPAISRLGRIWPLDMKPDLCKYSKHSITYFSADTVQ